MTFSFFLAFCVSNLIPWTLFMVHLSADRGLSDLLVDARKGLHPVIELLQVGGQVLLADNYQTMSQNNGIPGAYVHKRFLLAKSARGVVKDKADVAGEMYDKARILVEP
jgi:hypothetical protein